MRTIRSSAFQTTQHLPNHRRLLKASLEYFRGLDPITALFLKGGLATGKVGPFGTLDFGLLCENSHTREKFLSTHPDWKITPDLRLVKSNLQRPFQVTFVSDPSLRLEFHLYTHEDLPAPSEGPFLLAWDNSDILDHWIQEAQKAKSQGIDWSKVVHEDEQFWVWTHFSASQASRGEFHEVVHHLEDLREIVQNWQQRLEAMAKENTRRTGNLFRHEFLDRLTKTFCPPHGESIKEAYKNLIKIQLQQRALIGKTISPEWKVSPTVISKIQSYSLNW